MKRTVRRALLALAWLLGLFTLSLSGLWWAGWWRPGAAPPQMSGPVTLNGTPAGASATAPGADGPRTSLPAGPERSAPDVAGAGPQTPVPGTAPAPSPAQQLSAEPAATGAATGAPAAQGAPLVRGLAAAPPPEADQERAVLVALNRVRARAGLPGVQERAAWAAGCALHARYLVREDRAEHREAPGSAFRTPDGEACAPGHFFVTSRADSGALRALTYWVGGAFHLPQLLDPRLTWVAFGEAQDAAGGVRSAAVLDVRRGLSGTARYPVRYPAPGKAVPALPASTAEWPDALAGCPAVSGSRGAPVAALLGPDAAPAVTGVTLRVNGQAWPACLLTAQSFRGATETETQVGRGVLAAQGAAVALPDRPLPPGAAVQVMFRTTGAPLTWSFRVQGPQ